MPGHPRGRLVEEASEMVSDGALQHGRGGLMVDHLSGNEE
jgi:hypothetical protein